MTTTNVFRLDGDNALEVAEATGRTVSKYADPVEDARDGLTFDEAREVAREAAHLIYLDIDLAGRYSISAVESFEARGLGSLLFTTDDLAEANRVADNLAADYDCGVAITDDQSGQIDWGFGFGVAVPDEES